MTTQKTRKTHSQKRIGDSQSLTNELQDAFPKLHIHASVRIGRPGTRGQLSIRVEEHRAPWTKIRRVASRWLRLCYGIRQPNFGKLRQTR